MSVKFHTINHCQNTVWYNQDSWLQIVAHEANLNGENLPFHTPSNGQLQYFDIIYILCILIYNLDFYTFSAYTHSKFVRPRPCLSEQYRFIQLYLNCIPVCIF
jgi:hypothetical protein